VVRWLQTLPHEGLNESGFGGWADEKVEMAREAVALLSQKKNPSPTFDNSSAGSWEDKLFRSG